MDSGGISNFVTLVTTGGCSGTFPVVMVRTSGLVRTNCAMASVGKGRLAGRRTGSCFIVLSNRREDATFTGLVTAKGCRGVVPGIRMESVRGINRCLISVGGMNDD